MFNEKTTKAIKAIEEEAQAIEEAYELLSELEMKDKKTSYEYEYAVKTIKSCADIEDEYLKEILTKDYAEDVFNFFSKKYNHTELLIERLILSVIIAINSLFVGLPLSD